MSKRLYLSLGLFMYLLVIAGPLFSAEKGSLVITTLDLNRPYEVLGLVTSKVNYNDIQSLLSLVREEANKMGAEAIVGLRFTSYGDNFYAYGTAVRFRKEK